MPKYLKIGIVSVKSRMAVSILDIKKIVVFTLFQYVSVCFANSASSIISFGKAKGLLHNKVYGQKNRTFYCHCDYQKKSIKLNTCRILTKKYKKRKKRLEWEHVVPAHAFGQSFNEWRQAKKICPKTKSKRKCAAKRNNLFKEMEGNLHNLVPSVGAVNALRSNFSFIENTKGMEEVCIKRFWLNKRKVSVANDIRGDIARIYFYMNKTYPNRGIISKKNMKLFDSWSKIDPVSIEECRISKLKSLLQGSKNNFVEEKCK